MSGGQRLVPATVFLVLGGGFMALALGYGWFWWVWLVGYAVVLPLVAVLTGDGEPSDGGGESDRHREDAPESTADALDRLRERYADGELTDEQFEQKLQRLLETETVEGAAEYRERESEAERE